MGRRLAGRTDGNPPTEASSCCLMGRPRSGFLLVCLLVCQVVMTAPRVGLGEGGLGPDYLLGDQRVKLCFDVEEQEECRIE